MSEQKAVEAATDRTARTERRPFRVRLPGFVTAEEVGLGDAIKRATAGIGVPPRGGSAPRADPRNPWVVLTGGAKP